MYIRSRVLANTQRHKRRYKGHTIIMQRNIARSSRRFDQSSEGMYRRVELTNEISFPAVLQIVPECDVAGPTSYFWYRVALDASPGLDQPDGIKWKMLVSLFFSWFVVYLCICKGIKSSGKVSSRYSS